MTGAIHTIFSGETRAITHGFGAEAPFLGKLDGGAEAPPFRLRHFDRGARPPEQSLRRQPCNNRLNTFFGTRLLRLIFLRRSGGNWPGAVRSFPPVVPPTLTCAAFARSWRSRSGRLRWGWRGVCTKF